MIGWCFPSRPLTSAATSTLTRCASAISSQDSAGPTSQDSCRRAACSIGLVRNASTASAFSAGQSVHSWLVSQDTCLLPLPSIRCSLSVCFPAWLSRRCFRATGASSPRGFPPRNVVALQPSSIPRNTSHSSSSRQSWDGSFIRCRRSMWC